MNTSDGTGAFFESNKTRENCRLEFHFTFGNSARESPEWARSNGNWRRSETAATGKGVKRLRLWRGRENAERFSFYLKLDRADTDQFTVQLDRDFVVAAHAQPRRLEIFNFRQIDLGVEENVL